MAIGVARIFDWGEKQTTCNDGIRHFPKTKTPQTGVQGQSPQQLQGNFLSYINAIGSHFTRVQKGYFNANGSQFAHAQRNLKEL